MGLTQINNIFNDLQKLFDLIFINSIVQSKVTLAEFTISNWVVHHKPLCLNIEFYSLLPFNYSNPRYIFDLSSMSFLRICLLSLNWGALLSNPCIETNYKTLLSTIRNTLDSIVHSKVLGSYRLSWYTKGLQKFKNLRNKYCKKFSKTHNPADGERDRQHKREFPKKFRYNQYICEVEHSLKANPKAFWRFVNSKKSHSSIP